jgi:hypothetical protein
VLFGGGDNGEDNGHGWRAGADWPAAAHGDLRLAGGGHGATLGARTLSFRMPTPS